MVLLSQVRNAAKRIPKIQFRAHPVHKPEPIQTITAAQETVKTTFVSIIKYLLHDTVKVIT